VGQATPRGSPSVWTALQSACPGRERSERKMRVTETSSPRRGRLESLDSPPSICLNRQTDTRSSAERRIGSGAAGRKRRAASQSSELRKERPLLGAIFESPERSQTRSVLERAPRSQVAATHSRGGEPLDLGRTVGSESLETLYGASEPPRSLRWCQRRRDRGHLGPGSRCPLRGCAASLREGE
jgi:hypothetical protein